MKKIFSFLFAILFAVGTTGVFSSCQEDAPEITINITMNNDFSDVVNAINNGTLKQEAAIAALTAAINGMTGSEPVKLDALIEAINKLASTIDAKLAILEAAMKAQTLALEAKLDLLETAIKALPDYTEKLDAIEAAIKGMPDYSDKLAAIETAIKNIPDYSEKMAAIEAAIKNAPDYTTALEEIKEAIAALPDYTEKLGAIITAIENLPDYGDQLTAIKDAIPTIPEYGDQITALETALKAIAENIKAQEGQYADELAALKTSIDAIKSEVAAGNTSQEDALAEIIALLESGAIAGGGSGSGSGGEGSGGEGEGGEGEGGEGSGDEPTGPYILLKTNKSKGDIIEFACYDSELTSIKGVEGGVDNLQEVGSWNSGNGNLPLYRGKLTSQEVKLYGSFTEFQCSGEGLTEIDTQTQDLLVILQLYDNPGLKYYNFESNTNLNNLDLGHKTFSALEFSDLVDQLSPTFGGKLRISYDGVLDDIVDLIDDAEAKGWTITII